MKTVPNERNYVGSTSGTISDVNLTNERGENLQIEKSKIIEFSTFTTQKSRGIISIPMKKSSYGIAIMTPLAKTAGYFDSQTISVSTDNPYPKKSLTIDDLGWTKEQAMAIRGMFGSIAADWDDPSMDVYDDL